MSCEAPVIENSITSIVMIKIDFLSDKTVLVLHAGREKADDLFCLGTVFLSNTSTVGKTIKEIINDMEIPADIIQPRFIIGCICEKRREEKPAIVVIMAKKVGVDFVSIVKKTSLLAEARG